MKLETLNDLYLNKLRELHDSERQLLAAMDRVAETIDAEELAEGLHVHRTQSEKQLERLEKIFQRLREKPAGKKSAVATALAAEADQLLADCDPEYPEVLDAGVLGCLLAVEHYEISGYQAARDLARAIGSKDEKLLAQSLEEEQSMAQILTELAAEVVYPEALTAEEVAQEEEEETDEEEGLEDAPEPGAAAKGQVDSTGKGGHPGGAGTGEKSPGKPAGGSRQPGGKAAPGGKNRSSK